jgi:hypothetical protein
MRIRHCASFVCGTLAAATLLGLPGASAFADTTTTAAATPVTCKDGTTSPHGGRGSCSGHGGIDKAATAAAAGGTASGASTTSGGTSSTGGKSSGGDSSSSSTATGSATPAAPSSTHPPATQTATPKASPTSQAAAPGGGPGMVWVNSASKVYHCPNDRWYGKTKAGEYMTEADAKAKGNRADHNKPCS